MRVEWALKANRGIYSVEKIDQQGLVYYRFPSMNVKHGVFTRAGGVSQGPWSSLNLGGNVGDDPEAVFENFRRVFDVLGVSEDHACAVWQVHSADTVVVDGPVSGRRWVALADGMVTEKADTPLVMRFADCVPVLLHDPVQEVIGVAHAGWRGTVQGAGVSVVRTMVDGFGSSVENIRAGIGPSIGPDCYQVGEEVVAAVDAYFGDNHGLIKRDPSDGTAYLNLWEANAVDLRRNGVEQVEVAGICTATNTHEFFSHRAENGKTGRFVAVISL
jgi:YfiH family protein